MSPRKPDVSRPDVSRTAIDLLLPELRYEIALWDAVAQELARQGAVGLGQLHAPRVISRHDGQARVQDLSDDLGITVGAVSKLVDRVERDGLAARAQNPSNRRSSLIDMT